MLSQVESRIVLAPKWPQSCVTLAPSLFQPSSPRASSDERPSLLVTVQGCPPELGCPELAWVLLIEVWRASAVVRLWFFLSSCFNPKLECFLEWKKNIHSCAEHCTLRASVLKKIHDIVVSLCAWSLMHSVPCALPSLCSHAVVWHMLKSTPKTCLHWSVEIPQGWRGGGGGDGKAARPTAPDRSPLQPQCSHREEVSTFRAPAPPTPSSHGWQCLQRGCQSQATLLAALMLAIRKHLGKPQKPRPSHQNARHSVVYRLSSLTL